MYDRAMDLMLMCCEHYCNILYNYYSASAAIVFTHEGKSTSDLSKSRTLGQRSLR